MNPVGHLQSCRMNNGSGRLNPANGTFLNEFRMNEGVDISYTKFHDPAIDKSPFKLVEPEKELKNPFNPKRQGTCLLVVAPLKQNRFFNNGETQKRYSCNHFKNCVAREYELRFVHSSLVRYYNGIFLKSREISRNNDWIIIFAA